MAKKIAPKKPAPLDFGHPPETIRFWKRLVTEALSVGLPTPGYIFSALPIAERISEFDAVLKRAAGILPALSAVALAKAEDSSPSSTKLKIRHWLSCKTQPVAPLFRWWREQNRPIEVVSEFELRAALNEGFTPENILVNGPAKHAWLARFDLHGLSVNFDSTTEIAALLPAAKKWNWRCGVRINTSEEFDPENAPSPTQFGLEPEAAVAALKKLLRAKVRVETIHFHLRTNIQSAQVYQRAIAEVSAVCQAAKFNPLYLDLGGGLPVRHVLSRGGKVYDGEFGLRSFALMLRDAAKNFPGLQEIWLENGRFISAGSGVLVVKILDVKERRGLRQLICDGGRTMNALTSIWEQHKLLMLPERSGPETLTVVCGPTCMAFDQMGRLPLPRSLRAGDHLVWLDAGAYHIPWETRFSHGHAAVLWHDEHGLRPARTRQSFEDFWGQWK
jgi:diaminopimelate decarboxylase